MDKHTAKLLNAKIEYDVELTLETVKGEKTYESQFITFNLPAGTKFIIISAFTVDKPILHFEMADQVGQLDEF